MKQWRYILFAATACVPFFSTVQVSALTAVSDYIIITAKVLPTHTVLVDEQGIIQEIISNTTENTTNIKVYKNQSLKGNEYPLNTAVKAQYNALIKPGHSRVGTLYKDEHVASISKTNKTTKIIGSLLGIKATLPQAILT